MSYLNPMQGPVPRTRIAPQASTVAGSTMVAPARRKSSTADMKMRTISGSVEFAFVGLAQDADDGAVQSIAVE